MGRIGTTWPEPTHLYASFGSASASAKSLPLLVCELFIYKMKEQGQQVCKAFQFWACVCRLSAVQVVAILTADHDLSTIKQQKYAPLWV